MDLPQYQLKPNITRMILPQIFKLIGLAALFYLALWFNLKLGFNMEIPASINILVVVILIVLVVMQLLLYHIKYGKFKYLFYTNRVEFQGKKTQTFLFRDFQSINIKKNIFDSMTGTGSILFQPKFVVGPVNNVKQVKDYLQKLIQYYQYTQRGYTAQTQQQPMQRQPMQRQSVQKQSMSQGQKPLPQTRRPYYT